MERAITMDDNLSSPLSPLGQLRHAQNKWNISDLNDDELLATSSKDLPDSDTEIESGLGGGADVGQHNVVMVTNLDAITEEDGELSNGNSVSIRPTTIQQSRQQLQPHQTLCDVLADDDEVNEIEIALEDGGWRDYSSNYLVEENDLEDEELELAMEEDDSDRYDSAMPDNLLLNANDQIEQIDLPMTPAIPMSPIGLNPGSPQMRPISPSSMILTKVRQCVITGQLQQLETLLDATPNFFIDAILKAGWTALMYASYRGYPDIVEYCLKRGSDSNYHKEFFTSLMAVCSSMNPNEGLLLLCIDLLLEHGANVNAVDKFGCSALHYAARFGRTLLTKSLCENGAIINHVNRNGWSALHWAAAENHGYVVATLLDQNIDLTLKTRDGVTASQLASIRKNHDVSVAIYIAEALLEVEKSENETNTKIVSDMEIPNRSKRSIDNEMVEMENKLKSVNIDKDNDQNMLETRKEEAREIVINAIDAALARDLSRLMSNTNTNSSLESEDKMEIAGLKPGETCAELRKRLVESTEFDHDDEDIVENVLGRDDRLALIRQQSHGDSQFNILFVLILAFALFIILKFMFWLKS
ncbi:hypothetical protein RDWZM_010451 [Blomia tropicalis]|uniref:Uncharacterized protein n=1 Tax=Blomia tropicalis TaxID=40697 RepID=A0A9Q0RK46_BLOTA|nr:hypothetical protein RDWZM_010451 [Blomia tropicalis]